MDELLQVKKPICQRNWVQLRLICLWQQIFQLGFSGDCSVESYISEKIRILQVLGVGFSVCFAVSKLGRMAIGHLDILQQWNMECFREAPMRKYSSSFGHCTQKYKRAFA